MKSSLKRILAIDDEPMDLILLKRNFERSAPEFDVETCGGSEEAVARILNEETDLVFLDINMPGLNGFEVLETARKRMPGTFPPIIMLTTSSSDEDMSRAYEGGATAYVVKPRDLQGYRDLTQAVSAFWGGLVARPA